jgi:hypothetical protein
MKHHAICLISLFLSGPPAPAAEPGMDDAAFGALHALLRPQPGESRWMEIDWYPSVWEGRRKAAEEGKPLFLMAGSGGAPCAGC